MPLNPYRGPKARTACLNLRFPYNIEIFFCKTVECKNKRPLIETMNAAYFMIEELALNEQIVEQIKHELIEINVKRLLDYHLSIYELEEGEILEHWDLDDLTRIAKHIAIEQCKRLYEDVDNEEEPIEIVIHSDDCEYAPDLDDELWRLEFI
jgi:hypothetical protein